MSPGNNDQCNYIPAYNYKLTIYSTDIEFVYRGIQIISII